MILQHQPSFDIYDATKLQCYMDCPREYFYQFILGWRSDNPNIHLEFGSAIHLAMEHLIIHGYGDKSMLEAYDKFLSYYRQFFPDIMDDSFAPKNPAMAFRALMGYILEYRNDKFIPLYTEIAGKVTLTDKYDLHFKMDSVLDTPDGIKSREHKTGSQLSRQWIDQWALKMQTGVYNHVLYCLFPSEKVWGVEINGLIFSKKEIKYTRVPSRRTLQSMEVWYHNTIWWLDELTADMARLNECNEEDTVLKCFKMNTENCTKYFGCPYHDFCVAWPNPLSRCSEVPMGMKIEHWNPAEDRKDAKFVFDLSDGNNNVTKIENKEKGEEDESSRTTR